MCKAALPDGVEKDIAIIIIVANVLFPGVGTWIAAGVGKKCQGSTVAVGFGQFFLAIFIVGWVWALIWSMELYKKAQNEERAGGEAGAKQGPSQPGAPVAAPEPVAMGAPQALYQAPPAAVPPSAGVYPS